MQVPYIGRFVGEEIVTRPLAYAVSAHLGEFLQRHGLEIETPATPVSLDVEIAVVRGRVTSAGREILEANASSYLAADHRREHRNLPDTWCLVRTDQQYGAMAVYLCEAGSDDGLVACEVIAEPSPGVEFPAWRVLAIERS